MSLVVLLQTGRVAAEATVERLQAIEIDAQVIDDPNVFVKLTAGGNYQVRVVVPEEELERARAELARWEVESGPRIDALTREVKLEALRALRVFVVCVLASLAFGGAVYGLVRWKEVRAEQGRQIIDSHLLGLYLSPTTNGVLSWLHLEKDSRYRMKERVVEDEVEENVLRHGPEPEQGTWIVRLDSIDLRSDSGVTKSAHINLDGEYAELVLDGVSYSRTRPVLIDLPGYSR